MTQLGKPKKEASSGNWWRLVPVRLRSRAWPWHLRALRRGAQWISAGCSIGHLLVRTGAGVVHGAHHNDMRSLASRGK